MRALLISLVILSINSFALDQVKRSRTIHKITKKSDAIVRGKVLDIELGQKRSFIYLKVLEGTGIKPTEIQDTFIKVYFPVMTHDNTVESEYGLSFEANEEVVLFLKKKKGKFWLFQEAMGKYKVEPIAGKKVMISNVIKRNLDGGEISLFEFYKVVQFVKSVPLQWWENNEFVNKSFLEKSLMNASFDEPESPGRGIASVDTAEAKVSHRTPAVQPFEEPSGTGSVFWLVALLAMVGGAARLMWKNS